MRSNNRVHLFWIRKSLPSLKKENKRLLELKVNKIPQTKAADSLWGCLATEWMSWMNAYSPLPNVLPQPLFHNPVIQKTAALEFACVRVCVFEHACL